MGLLGTRRSMSLPLSLCRESPPGPRSTCPAAAAALPAEPGPGRTGGGSFCPGHERDRVTEVTDDGGGASGLVVAGDPERDRARPHVGGGGQRQVLDVDPFAGERERDVGGAPG